jgi:hypothetical protein
MPTVAGFVDVVSCVTEHGTQKLAIRGTIVDYEDSRHTASLLVESPSSSRGAALSSWSI